MRVEVEEEKMEEDLDVYLEVQSDEINEGEGSDTFLINIPKNSKINTNYQKLSSKVLPEV
jgi:hypothetical protein